MEGASSTRQGRTGAQVSPTGPGGSTAGARISPPHPPAPRGLGARTMALTRVKPTQGTLPQSRKTPPQSRRGAPLSKRKPVHGAGSSRTRTWPQRSRHWASGCRPAPSVGTLTMMSGGLCRCVCCLCSTKSTVRSGWHTPTSTKVMIGTAKWISMRSGYTACTHTHCSSCRQTTRCRCSRCSQSAICQKT